MKYHGRLQFTSQRDCFVSLPQEWIAQVTAARIRSLTDEVMVFRLDCEERSPGLSATAAWSGRVSSVMDVVEMSGEFGALLRLQNGDKMSVELLSESVVECGRVKLVPVAAADWTDIAAHGEFIEENLLRIVRIILIGEEFPVWLPPTGNKIVRFRVVGAEPRQSFLLLTQNTVVEICPHFDNSKKIETEKKEKKEKTEKTVSENFPAVRRTVSYEPTSSPWLVATHDTRFPWTSFILDMFRNKTQTEKNEKNDLDSFQSEFLPVPPGGATSPEEPAFVETVSDAILSAFFRVQEVFPKKEKNAPLGKNIVFVSLAEFRRDVVLMEDVVVPASLTLVPVAGRPADRPLSFDVSVRLLGRRSGGIIFPGHFGVEKNLLQNLNLTVFDIVKITITESSMKKSDLVHVHDTFQQRYKILPDSFLDKKIFPVVFPTFFEQMKSAISLSLSLTPLPAVLHPAGSSTYAGLLLSGRFGTGKTTVLAELARALEQWPYLVHTEVIECKYVRGKRPDTLRKTFEAAVQEAVHKQPAVIFLDDVEYLAPHVATESDAEVEYAARVAQILVDVQDRLQLTKERVMLVASTASRSLVQKLLVDSGSTSVFQSFMDVPVLDWDQRLNLLRFFCRERDLRLEDSLTLGHYADKTDGYVLRDFGLLFKRLAHENVLRAQLSKHPRDEETITAAAFEAVFLATQPHTKQNVTNTFTKLSLDGLKWADVGGLKTVKKVLHDIFELPIRFPKLYAKCPMRLPRGVLLFGLPGTGKTFVAGVLAKELSIGFIHIRGPELLSKYIGASEAKVRDVFERAKAAKPCLVFFDEFEAIAPRRGHDSTGVTDRVVNQLLTELDGMEKLEGVYVLAATSRPELIDPAILRPGRIDKCICCPLPTTEERLEILTAIVRNVSLDPSVDLAALADATENFSGADLKSILIDAQLDAVESNLINQINSNQINQINSNQINFNQINFNQIDFNRIDFNQINSNQINFNQIDFNQINFNRIDFNQINLNSGSLSEIIKISYRHSLLDDPLKLTAEDSRRMTEEIRTLVRFDATAEKNADFSAFQKTSEKNENKKNKYLIKNEHVLKALRGKFPSISDSERRRFEKLAENIQRNGVASLVEDREFEDSPMRVTLA